VPSIIAKLLLSIAAMVGGAFAFLLTAFVLEDGYRGAWALLAAVCVGAAAFTVAWFLIWAGEVRWRPWRVVWTATLFGVSVLFGFTVGAILDSIVSFDEPAIIVGAMAWLTLWLSGTPLVWRETRGERRERLALLGVGGSLSCPTCGYPMRGLHEAKCPECGSRFTLEQLFAALTSRDADHSGGTAGASAEPPAPASTSDPD